MPPPQMRMRFMFAAAALCTAATCAASVLRPSSSSSGIQFAPRAKMSAPLTLKRIVRLPLPGTPARRAGSESSAVTSARLRKATRRCAETEAPVDEDVKLTLTA